MFHPPIGDRGRGRAARGPVGVRRRRRGPAGRRAPPQPLQHLRDAGCAPDGRVAQQAAAAGRDDPARHPGDDLVRPAPLFDENAVRRAGRPARSRSGPSRSGSPRPRDEELVRGFGEIARQEYRAVGIHVALHPMADVATEPRWARIGGTFGEDVELVGRLTAAYIRGFQGDELGPTSVACMTKHFPGGGPRPTARIRIPVREGSGLPRRALRGPPAPVRGGVRRRHRADHAVLRPSGRNRARAGRLRLQPWGDHGPAARPLRLRRRRLHRLGARQRLPMPDGSVWEAKAWGVEELTLPTACEDHRRGLRPARRRAAARAPRRARRGGPRVGGAHRRVGAADSARQVPPRALRRPYVDPEAAATICGREEFRAAGDEAQRRAHRAACRTTACSRSARRAHVTSTGFRTRPRPPTARSSSTPLRPTRRSCSGTRRTSLATGRSSSRSSTPAASSSRPRARPHPRDRARGPDDRRRVPRPPRDPDRDRRRLRRRGRHFGASPTRDPRPRLRCVRAERQAAVRAALVDGRRAAGSCPTCRATRSAAVPARARPQATRAQTIGGSRCLTLVPGEVGAADLVRELLRDLGRDGQHFLPCAAAGGRAGARRRAAVRGGDGVRRRQQFPGVWWRWARRPPAGMLRAPAAPAPTSCAIR